MNDFVDKLIKNTWMEAHKKTIEGILQEVNQKSDAYILKGGTSLMECYNLTRFSEDIDFDSVDKETIFKIIDDYCEQKSFKNRTAKKTDTVSRIMIDYGGKKPLKVEVSHRRNHINDEDVNTVNGIKVYTLDNIASFKANAYMGRDKIRDLYDICFLVNEKYEELSPFVIRQIRSVVEQKGFEQFDYIIKEQSDELINPEKLSEDFMKMFDRLDLLTPKPEETIINSPIEPMM